MALYNSNTYFVQSTDPFFNLVHGPATVPGPSGIYRCEGCGREIASNENTKLPPQNHHQHTVKQGAIRWRLIAASQTNN